MKYLSLIVLLIALNGCTYYSHTRVAVAGKNVKVPIKGMTIVGGEDLVTYLNREMCVGLCSKKKADTDAVEFDIFDEPSGGGSGSGGAGGI